MRPAAPPQGSTLSRAVSVADAARARADDAAPLHSRARADIDKDGNGTIDFQEFLEMMTSKMSEKDSREEILKAFRLFDDEEKGKISFRNLKRVAKELGENMTDEELMEMIEEADRDGDGEINEEEFLRIMKEAALPDVTPASDEA